MNNNSLRRSVNLVGDSQTNMPRLAVSLPRRHEDEKRQSVVVSLPPEQNHQLKKSSSTFRCEINFKASDSFYNLVKNEPKMGSVSTASQGKFLK